MSAPTSADTESQQPARRIIRGSNKMLHKKSKSVILTLALHGHCDVNIYFQFTVDDKQNQSIPTRACKYTRVRDIVSVRVDWAKRTWKNPCPPRIRTSSTCLYRQRTPGRPAVPWRWRLSETLRMRQSHILPFVLFHLHKKKKEQRSRWQWQELPTCSSRGRGLHVALRHFGEGVQLLDQAQGFLPWQTPHLCAERLLQNIKAHVQCSSWFRSFNILFSFLCSFQDVWQLLIIRIINYPWQIVIWYYETS